MDKFEKHIRKNQSQFDEHNVDADKLWANIETALDDDTITTEKPKRLWQNDFLKIVASIVIVFGLFTLTNSLNKQPKNRVSQEVNDIENHYKALVNYQVNLVHKNTKLSTEDKKEFLLFMDELDEEYEVLKSEIQKDINSEQILEAIILNYKKRIELIENLLKQINNSEQNNNNNEYIL